MSSGMEKRFSDIFNDIPGGAADFEEFTRQLSGPDLINSPSHYKGQYPFEVIDIIKLVLNEYGEKLTPFECYCLGNQIKYRLRAGFKDDIERDIGKALKYKEFADNEREEL